MSKHYLIYVPGLSDHPGHGQAFAVKLWRTYGVKSEVMKMRWAEGNDFDEKLGRLLARIDELTDLGYAVSLVGASAGGAAVMNAYARRPSLHAVVSICGILNPAVKVNPRYYRENPAFKTAMNYLGPSLEKLDLDQRRRILSIRPLADSVVYPRNTKLAGASHAVIPTMGHAFSIAFGILFYVPAFVIFIKRLASKH